MMKLTFPEGKSSNRLYIYILFLFFLTLALRIFIATIYRADCNGSDQNVIYGIQRILMGESLYQNPSEPSYAIIQYMPLFYHIVAGVAMVFQVKYNDIQTLYIIARSTNIIFNLLSILFVAGIISRWQIPLKRIWIYALPIIFITTPHYYTRIDSCQLLFFVASISMYFQYLFDNSPFKLIFAAILCAACVMSKQNGILSVGIIGFSLLLQEKKYIQTVVFSTSFLLSFFLLAKLLNGSNWLSFYQNAYLGVKNGIYIAWILLIFISQFYYDLILCYVCGFIMAWLALRKINDSKFRFIATGAVLSFGFALITGFKVGSSNNYFTELLVFVLAGMPVLVGHESSGTKLFNLGKKTITIRLFATISFFILVSSKTMGLFSSVIIEKRMVSEKDEYDNVQQLHNYFTNHLLLQDFQKVYFTQQSFLDNVFIRNSVLPTKDVIEQTWKANHTTFDYSGITQGINNGYVSYAVTEKTDTSLNMHTDQIPFIKFDEAKWKRGDTIGKYVVYTFVGATN